MDVPAASLGTLFWLPWIYLFALKSIYDLTSFLVQFSLISIRVNSHPIKSSKLPEFPNIKENVCPLKYRIWINFWWHFLPYWLANRLLITSLVHWSASLRINPGKNCTQQLLIIPLQITDRDSLANSPPVGVAVHERANRQTLYSIYLNCHTEWNRQSMPGFNAPEQDHHQIRIYQLVNYNYRLGGREGFHCNTPCLSDYRAIIQLITW